MALTVIVYILTALACVVVALTRLRLGGDRSGAGRFSVSPSLVNTHTIAGVGAIIFWVIFLVTGIGEDRGGNSLLGIIGLSLFWLTTVVGLMILFRWLPTKGKHSSDPLHDSWSRGPGLSVLAHVGMFVGVCIFTWAYLTSAV